MQTTEAAGVSDVVAAEAMPTEMAFGVLNQTLAQLTCQKLF